MLIYIIRNLNYKIRDMEESKRMELEKKRKEEQEKYNKQEKEMEKLKKELDKLKNEGSFLKKEVVEKNKQKQKEKEKEELIPQISQIENEQNDILQKEKENLEGNNIIQFSVTSSIKDDDWEILVAQSINF